MTIEIVVPKCHHFDGHGFAAPKKRRPKRGLFRVLVHRRWRLGQSDESEVRRFSAERQAINKTRIAFVAIEQVADFQPVGPVLLHFKSPGPIAARRVEFRPAEVGVRSVKLVRVRNVFFAFVVFGQALKQSEGRGRQIEPLRKYFNPINLAFPGVERKAVLVARRIKLADNFTRQ